MNRPTNHPSLLDLATRTATAFESFSELQSACATGYVPTLIPDELDLHHAWAVRTLRAALETRERKVWPA